MTVFGLLAALSLSPGTARAQTVSDPRLEVVRLGAALQQPTGIAFIGADDLLAIQKNNGQVWRVTGGVVQPGPVLDVPVQFDSERGLLGITTDPDFINNRRVYLYYTESATGADNNTASPAPLGNRVYRFNWDGARLVDPVLLLNLPATPGPNHDGGVITFGPDDALYAVIGDLNRNGKLENYPAGPDPDDTGVVLRTDGEGRSLPDNPFYDALNPAAPLGRTFAYGVRNSFGLAFDPVTGDLWESENGPGSYDEINRVVPGFNGGWEQIMGPDGRDPQGIGDLWMAPGATYRDPEFSWATPVAPTALAFAKSRILGCDLENDLFVGDNNCGQIYRFDLTPARDALLLTDPLLQDRVADNTTATRCTGETSTLRFGTGFGVVTDLENGPDGRLYLVSYSLGGVFRIGPKAGAFPDADRDGAADACDCAPGVGSAFAAPAEVPRIRVGGAGGGAPATLGWDPQAATAGTGTTYRVVTGDLAALRADRGFASACALADGIAAPALGDPRVPAPGTGLYYLAAAANACADGTFGSGSGTPDPRDPLDAALPAPCPCADRRGGAFVTFAIGPESLTVWVTDGAFIDRAKEHLANGTRQVPIFNTLVDGRDCDPQWTWHTGPADVVFADAAIELCDGLPSHVEADKDYWIKTVGAFCPWSAVVVAVDDRR